MARLIQEDGLEARARKRSKQTTMSDHDQPVAANILDRQFVPEAPNQSWVGATTEFVIGLAAAAEQAILTPSLEKAYIGAVLPDDDFRLSEPA